MFYECCKPKKIKKITQEIKIIALRIRPLTDRDRAQPRFANLAHDDVLKIHESTVQVVPQNKLFTFDHVFGTTSTQKEIFSALGDNLIRKFVEGTFRHILKRKKKKTERYRKN